MGLLAEFIVATEDEALAFFGEPNAFPSSHKAEYTSFTEVELGTLYHITQGKVVDVDTIYDFNIVRELDDGAQLTTELLPDLVARLSAASDRDLASWAETWGATEELGCIGAEVLPVLGDLRRLSKLARAESKSVYLWNSV